MADPVEFIKAAPFGTRMTVRTRIVGGYTDAIGYLRSRDDDECTLDTRHGIVTIAFNQVHLAKAVPPPPPRRVR